ncbi:hypothetical protein CC86DRAFT_101224 [Ophiobolus disseminans]|uniref:PARP catalytic domain-containing protein n=1 Tax=Ophiobolus disseminans TaxID=1469910 RepID=A0A6A6ZNK4_9PLEO|nr:hypothetical protein CC86DRAFT_101224 [Ophiobolus disseminans]
MVSSRLFKRTTIVPLPLFDQIQRTALDIHQDAQTIFVNLWKDANHQVVQFCLHLDQENTLDRHDYDTVEKHTPWNVYNGQPYRAFCGTPNRLLYQLNRFVQKYFQHGVDRTGNLLFWDELNDYLHDMHGRCVCCGQGLGTDKALFRSTACSRTCSLELRTSQLRIRCAEAYEPGLSFRLLLTAIKVAMQHGYFAHLPPLPMNVSQHQIQTAISAMLNNWAGFREQIRRETIYGEVELSVSWVLTAYRGCLAWWRDAPSAIFPHLGLGQVFLVNSRPEIEKAFQKNQRCAGGNTTLVYHGTSIDRLYPVLWEGLQVLSDTELSATGAKFGRGIYTASNSADAAGYSRRTDDVPADQAPYDLVLLVCELLSPTRHAIMDQDEQETGYYLTTNPADMIVRAVVMADRADRFADIDSLALQRFLRERKR